MTWPPQSEADLAAAEGAGMLEEGHQIELKRELSSNNAELAKDLASLAIDGGLLLVGVADSKNRPPALVSGPLAGLPERIDQVASMRCQPPLFVEILPILSDADPDSGFVLVNVPPSAQAPHMVDGRYWGRDDRTKRSLSDTEVALLMRRRETVLATAEAELSKYVQRDPVVSPSQAHFYGVAIPLHGRRLALLDAIDRSDEQRALRALVLERARPSTTFAPDLEAASQFGRRDDGWAFSSFEEIAPARQFESSAVATDFERYLIEVEISEDGAIRMLNGHVTADGAAPVIFHRLVAGMARTLLAIAASVGQQMQYPGTWFLGVAIRGPLLGAVPYTGEVWPVSRFGVPYTSNEYRELATSTTAEMFAKPGDVAMRLAGRFFRALKVDGSRTVLDEIER